MPADASALKQTCDSFISGVESLAQAVRARQVAKALRERGAAALDEHQAQAARMQALAEEADRLEGEAGKLRGDAVYLEESEQSFDEAHVLRKRADACLVQAQGALRKRDALQVRYTL